MKKLTVHYVKNIHGKEDIIPSLDEMKTTPVDTVNWPEYSYKPRVEFSMLWNDLSLFLKYRVEENFTMALTDKDNGPVWKDSCVEFFVSPDANDYYYNFEINCIGTCLLAWGNSRHNREFAAEPVLNQIKRYPSYGRKAFTEITGNNRWDIHLEIPFACFFRHPDFKPGSSEMKANFYKCGDGLSTPHYLTWNPIRTEKPDYHRPEFFGVLELVR